MPLKGLVRTREEDARRYLALGCWTGHTLWEDLRRVALSQPDKEALVDNHRRLTYGQLATEAERLAASMSQLGIGRGDAVLLQLPNWHEFVLSFFALHSLGAAAVLVLPRHRQLEIGHFCRMTEPKAWILPLRHRNADYAPVIRDVTEAAKSIQHVIAVRSSEPTSFITFERLLEKGEAEATRRSERPSAGDVAFVIPTGGTTGLPKAVPRTHNDAACEARYRAEARGQTAADTCLIAVPLEHNLGLAALNGTLHQGGRLVMLDSTRAEDICATIQRERVTCAPIVPTLLARLIEFEGLPKYDLSSLRALYVGGAKTPPDVIRRTRERIGNVYMTAFGMSEGAGCTSRLDDPEDTILNTIGRPTCPYDTYRVVDAIGRELPPGSEGELLVKGPGIFAGYLGNPAENKRAFTEDGFFRTGDLAVIDSTGVIRITGRIKDIIIRGGENISPAEIEMLVRQHPAVADVAVVGIPDRDLGERACACIQLKGSQKLSLEELVAFLKQRGASVLQLPERLVLIGRIPRTAVGKPDKRTLQTNIVRQLETES